MKIYLIALLAVLHITLVAQEQSSYSAMVHEITRINYPKADTLLKQFIATHKMAKSDDPALNQIALLLGPMKFVQVNDDKVLVDIAVEESSDGVFEGLKHLGLERASRYQTIISGFIPIDKIDALMKESRVRFVNLSLMNLHVGAATTQGDSSMHTNDARTHFNVSGQGVRVGTLSDSYDSLGGAQADILSGDLPANPMVLSDLPANAGTDEGRAMMQIIHDIAPGAQLLFRSGAQGQADLAQGIIDLANANAQIIVDDITYFDAPFFQDGIVAQAATKVIKDGIHYFSAAGNLNEHSYQAPFVNSGMNAPVVGGNMHDFGGGDTFQSFTLPNDPGDNVLTLIFQWNQPFKTACPGTCPGPSSNLDIYLRDQMSGTIVAASEIDNVAAGVAFEAIQYANIGGGPQVLELFIVHRSGPIPSLIKYILPSGPSPDEFDTQSSTSFGQANGDRVIAVGSSAFYNTPAFGVDPALPNSSSSLGGTPIYFNSADNSPLSAPLIRQTPDITGPDGGNNTFFGNDTVNDADTLPNFFGTSAAAPHVAGLAALILDNSISKLSPQDVETILEISALDMASPGYDFKSGYGLVQADGDFGAVCGDIDGDSFCNNEDECPNDPDKIEAGLCGCGHKEGTCDKNEDRVIHVDEVVDEIPVPIPVPVPALGGIVPPLPSAFPEPLNESPGAALEEAPSEITVAVTQPSQKDRLDDAVSTNLAKPSSCYLLNKQDNFLFVFTLILMSLLSLSKRKYLK